MHINEDYFEDLGIENEDIIEDDILDVEGTKIENAQKLPEQYSHNITIGIKNIDKDTTFFQTSLIPRIFKRLDAILDFYGIEHSLYILTSIHDMKYCETIVEFGDYQLFCKDDERLSYTTGAYDDLFIQVFVNYPKFNYKRAFRFVFTVLNLYRIDEQFRWIVFTPSTANDYDDTQLQFWIEFGYIDFHYYDIKTNENGNIIDLSKILTEADKIEFYNSVTYYFGCGLINYDTLERNIPLKPLRLH